MNDARSDTDTRRSHWRTISRIVAAHVAMLFEAGLIDEDAKRTLLAAIDAVSGGQPPDGPLAAMIAQFDDRLDVQSPPGATGVARVGRGIVDTLATSVRMTLRDQLLTFAAELDRARRAALDLAAAHVTTLMPVYVGGQPAQPTTFAHFLGGLLGPLSRGATRIHAVYTEVNLSPLGAGALASSGIGIERERTAELLGFDGLVINTFDAVSAVDHFVACGDLATGIAASVRRFLVELLTWLRTDSGSFHLRESWTSTASELPQLRGQARLEALIAATRAVDARAAATRIAAAERSYGPLIWGVDELVLDAEDALRRCTSVLQDLTALLTSDLEVNRAYLANRAGRGHTTSSDLADFLMIEEQLEPGVAQHIAALITARIIADGIEVSGITPEIIDAAALMAIGRELKVEFEAISRYLAPRRFLERRTATGAPSPISTRAYLDQERLRLAADERWREAASDGLQVAAAGLRATIDEAIAGATSG